MKLAIEIRENAPHQVQWLGAFRAGAKKHGVKIVPIQEADVVAGWGLRVCKRISNQRGQQIPFIVVERGYFNGRERFASAGWNGLNGRADFKNADSPPDRWEKHGVELKPWHSGSYTLVMGQVMGDASIQGVDIEKWYAEVIQAAKDQFTLPVLFRPHPSLMGKVTRPDVHVVEGHLAKLLSNANVVIIYNSNSGVDAIIAGVPTITYDKGSMVWPITSHAVEDMIMIPRRLQWARNLAYCQWTEEEMRDGLTWEHLNKGTVDRL